MGVVPGSRLACPAMLAVTCARISPDDPLAGLAVGDHPDPDPPPGWEVVEVRAAALNHHDLWALRGVALDADRVPMVLGSDAAGVTADGREVVVHAVVADPDADHELLDRTTSILSEVHPGTQAERVAVPTRSLLPKPDGLSFAEAACLPTAYLTAYRMLFTRAGLRPGDTVLVQGAGGGVATASVLLGRAAGLRVWVTSRDQAKGRRAVELGAEEAFAAGERLPRRVDAVVETVGEATFGHSLRAVRSGGVVVVSGATTGPNPPAELHRVFARQISVVGSTMGTRAELRGLCELMAVTGAAPVIDAQVPLERAREAYERLAGGEVHGKLVLTVD